MKKVSYSFIAPAKKPIFSMFSRIWIMFISTAVLLMLIFDFFIKYQIYSYNSDIKSMQKEEKKLEQKIVYNEKIKHDILEKQKNSNEIYAQNKILQESMNNLFDLVPDQITLTEVIMEEKKLILYGITPSKDTYNFLLASPLRSIFHKNDVLFYLNKKGWYRFVSTNIMNDSDVFNE